VREHNGPFSFQEIAIDLLAVAVDLAGEVENVVGDLERRPQQIAEPVLCRDPAVIWSEVNWPAVASTIGSPGAAVLVDELDALPA